MRIVEEEIFGPVLSVIRFNGFEEAMKLANGTEFGLGNTVWTKNVDTALAASQRLRSGTVWVNTTLDTAPQMPFGGVKASGHGREMGRAGLEEFIELKSCSSTSASAPLTSAERVGVGRNRPGRARLVQGHVRGV